MKAISILIILSLLLFSSCKKYDGDEKRSWQTVKKRIIDTWSVDKLTYQYEGDAILEEETLEHEMSFEENGNYKSQRINTFTGELMVEEGTWELSSDKEHIIIRNPSGELLHSLVIRRLEKDAFTLSTHDWWPRITHELVPA